MRLELAATLATSSDGAAPCRASVTAAARRSRFHTVLAMPSLIRHLAPRFGEAPLARLEGAIKAGYPVKNVPLAGFAYDTTVLEARCYRLQAEMNDWLAGRRALKPVFDGTVGGLINFYQTDKERGTTPWCASSSSAACDWISEIQSDAARLWDGRSMRHKPMLQIIPHKCRSQSAGILSRISFNSVGDRVKSVQSTLGGIYAEPV